MRYLLFSGDSYYANGGAGDIKGAFSSITDALIAYVTVKEQEHPDWFHIYDVQDNLIVAGHSGGYCGQLPDPDDGWFIRVDESLLR